MEEMYIDPKQNKQNDLTEKQKLFCLEYLVDFNATKAAIRAGYSEHSARSIASENLTKPDIIKYIQQTSDQMFTDLGLNHKRILHELATLAFDQKNPPLARIKALEILYSKHICHKQSENSLNSDMLKNAQRAINHLRNMRNIKN